MSPDVFPAQPLVGHPALTAVADDASLWRYMDLAKLVSLLQTNALHFARLDRLGDPFEGSVTSAVQVSRATDRRSREVDWSFVMGRVRQFLFASCWSHSDVESAALWQLYAAGGGLAIRTTQGQLVRALGEPVQLDGYEPRGAILPSARTVLIGKVNYVDYSTAAWDTDDLMRASMHKRLSYAHEQEVRALVSSPDDAHRAAGLYLAVDVNVLIGEIYVSPESPTWFREVVEGVADRFQVAAAVRQSSLDAPPLF